MASLGSSRGRRLFAWETRSGALVTAAALADATHTGWVRALATSKSSDLFIRYAGVCLSFLLD